MAIRIGTLKIFSRAIEVLTVASEDGFVQLKILRDGKSRCETNKKPEFFSFLFNI